MWQPKLPYHINVYIIQQVTVYKSSVLCTLTQYKHIYADLTQKCTKIIVISEVAVSVFYTSYPPDYLLDQTYHTRWFIRKFTFR